MNEYMRMADRMYDLDNQFEQLKKKNEELEKENKLLGERCTQLLKDKGDLTDQIADIKANCDFAIEGRDIKIKELEKQVKDLEWQLQEVVKDNDNYQAENKRLEKENAELDMKRKAERKIFQGIVEKNNDQLTKATKILQTVFDKWKEERWILQSEKEVKQIENLMKQVEQFIKEIEK